MNVTLKQIPADTYKVIQQSAEEHGRSLNAQIIFILATQAEEIERRRKMRESRDELDRFVESLAAIDSSANLIREDRER